LGLLTHPFFHDLLHYYKIELHHLALDGILHVAAFIMLCEAFLGIRPHFDHWKHFFIARVTVVTKDGKPHPLISGIILQLRGGKSWQYFCLPLATFNKGRDKDWFLISNHESGMLAFTSGVPVHQGTWSQANAANEQHRLELVLKQVVSPVRKGLIGKAVLQAFFAPRIQPH
jgi:hypothetical protein